MSRIETIQEVLAPHFLAQPGNKLSETNKDNRGRPVEMERLVVSNGEIRYVLYRFDPDEKDIFPFFSPASGLKRICDYILFAEAGKQCWCLLIEMKKGNNSPHPQLAASEAFVRYVIDAANRIGKEIVCTDILFRRIGIPEFKKKKANEREDEVTYDAGGYLQLTSRALRLPALLQ